MHARGTAQYGDPKDDTQAWSIPWTLEEYDEFLFASGDKKYWLVVSKEELIGADGGEVYANKPINVIASSYSCKPYQGIYSHYFSYKTFYQIFLAKMYRRKESVSGNPADPLVSIRDHHGGQQMVYAEDSYKFWESMLAHGGMDVFIRTKGKIDIFVY